MLGPLKNKLNQLMQGAGAAAQRKPGDIFHRGACRVSRQEAVHKLHQLQQSIGDWEGKELVREMARWVYTACFICLRIRFHFFYFTQVFVLLFGLSNHVTYFSR